jgi:hypothetical protein
MKSVSIIAWERYWFILTHFTLTYRAYRFIIYSCRFKLSDFWEGNFLHSLYFRKIDILGVFMFYLHVLQIDNNFNHQLSLRNSVLTYSLAVIYEELTLSELELSQGVCLWIRRVVDVVLTYDHKQRKGHTCNH